MPVKRTYSRVSAETTRDPSTIPIWSAGSLKGVPINDTGLDPGEAYVFNGVEFVPVAMLFLDGTTPMRGNLDMDEYGVVQVGFQSFDTVPTPPAYSEGNVYWSTDDKTLNIESGLDSTTLQVGQEEWIQIKNQTGSLIPNMTVVMFVGTLGSSGRILGGPMVADGSEPAMKILGITTMDIPNGEDGFVTTFGKIRGVDTSTWADGDILWADPAVPGGLTASVPTAPNLKLPIAVVVKSDLNNGSIFVRVTSGSSLHDDHYVEVSGLAAGDLLQWTGTRWENKPSASVTSATPSVVVYNKSSNYTALAENQLIVCDASGGAFTLSLPAASSAKGYTIRVKKADASGNAVTLDPSGTETIDDLASVSITVQYTSMTLISDGTGWWVV